MSRAFMIKQAPFKPTDIGGCQLWLDGADSTSASMILSGSTVSTWKDKSSNAYNFTQSSYSTSLPPLSNLANQRGVYFGSLQALYNTTYAFPTTYTIFSVANQLTRNSYQYILHSPYNADHIIFFGSLSGNFATFAGPAPSWNDVNANSPTSVIATTSNTASLLCCTNDGTTLIPYFNAVSLNTKVGTNATATGMTIGDTDTADARQPWLGTIGEIIIYTSILSDTNRRQVESYLAQKWGLQTSLPQGHPGTRGIVYPSQPIPTAIYWRYPSTFVPTSIGNCQLWLDASDTTKIGPSGGGTLTSWTDKSGTGKTVTIANAPSYSTTGFNTSYPCVTFTSANSLTISITAPGTTDIAMFAVWTCTTSSTPNPPNNSDVLSIGGPASGSETAIGWNSLSTAYVLYTYNVGGSVSPTNIGLNIPLVESGIQLSGTQYVYVNGYDPASTGGSVYNQTNTTVYIGGGSAFRLQGQVAEVLYYNSTFTTSQRQQIEGYLAWKWGLQGSLPANHPYKNSSPNITNPAGISRPANVLPIPPIVCSAINRIPSVPSGVITSGLVSFFTFDNTLADSKNTITLSQTGSVSYVTGRRNQAVYLANESNSTNGTTATNYLTSSYNITVPFSVVVWFNPTNVTNGSLLSTYNSTAITNYSVNLYIQAAGGGMSAAYNAIQNVGAYTGVSIGTWYNAVITVNASNGLSLFVNGSQIGSTITQTPSINGLMIGNIRDGGGSYAYSGYLEDYRIYNRVLSGTEISQIYAGTG